MENNLRNRIRLAEDKFSRSERRLAEIIIRLGGHLLHYSAAELASHTEVSQSTITRFFKRLGYKHYRHALIDVRHSFDHLEADAFTIENRLRETNISRQLELHLSSELQNIRYSLQSLDEELIKSTVTKIASSEKIWVVGLGDDYALAHHARSILIRIKPDIRMIPLGGFSIPEEFVSITERDVILAFTQSRTPPLVIKIVASGQAVGASIIQMAGQHVNPLPDVIHLSFANRGAFLFQSTSAAFSLVSYLCSEVAAILGEPAVKRLFEIESLHEDWSHLDNHASPTLPKN